jgi:carboxyl-terminal processing protease
MKFLKFLWLLVLFLAALWLGFNAGRVTSVRKIAGMGSAQNKVNEALQIIGQNYVDSVDVSRLAESAVIKMVSELDPHSSYVPATDVEASNEDLESSFSGIGIQFNMVTDTIIVINIISGGPAEKAGLMPFDRIITVDDSVVAGKDLPSSKIIRMLRGPKDTKVKLGVQRNYSEQLTTFELTRGDIPNYSVDVAYKVSEETGYIKIKNFTRSTYSEFLTSIAQLRQQGATSFIIDLRDNPGGYMEPAIYLSNEFLPRGRSIVYTQGNAYPRSDTYSNGKGSCQDLPLVVLINELSGSASEIFTGAIQDNDRGLVIGRRSYGKGLVQTRIAMSDRSELVLTIARYYTPSGRCIQKEYNLGQSEEYGMDLYNRYVHGEYFSADSIHVADSLEYKTVGGRTVYGGGGIMPDIFIPRDTIGITSYFINVYNNNVLLQYAVNYSDKNHDRLSSFTNYKELYAYLKSQPILNEFTDYAVTKGIKKQPQLIAISKELIETQLHAYIIRNFFDNEGFYPVLFKDDPVLKKAIEVIDADAWRPLI